MNSAAAPVSPPAPAFPSAAGRGEWMHGLCAHLYPLMRSLTGDGVRETLRRIGEHVALEITEVPSGKAAFDWTVPKEWNVREAWIKGPDGTRVVDVATHTLHLMNYSAPFRGRMSLQQLRPHLHALADRPDWIPYRTSYFKEDWAFCLTQKQLDSLPEGEYEVCVDTTLDASGSLTFGECILKGDSPREVFVTAHICHPSLANDNLSGISAAVAMAQSIAALPRRRFTWRFLFVPATVGAITWLAEREAMTPMIEHGIVISGVGDPGRFHYKQSRRGDAPIDRIMAAALEDCGYAHEVNEFMPYGYDERQYCSPGFNLPVGCLSRSTYGSYPQYHTSGDNLDFIRPQFLEETLAVLLRAAHFIERDRRLLNLNPKCEPQLGRRGLYSLLGGHNEAQKLQLALLWVLNQSDGQHSLFDISRKARLGFALIEEAANALIATGLARDLQ